MKKRLSMIEITQNIFNVLAYEKEPCSIKRIYELSKLPKSSVYKVIKSLTSTGFVKKEDGDKYFFGAKMMIYGDLYVHKHGTMSIIKQQIDHFAQNHGFTTQLCTCINNRYMTIYEVVPEGENAIRSEVLGRNLPIIWTASGRILLKYKTRKELHENLTQKDLLLPDNTKINETVLLREIQRGNKENFFMLNSALNNISVCLAVGISLENAENYTICISIPKTIDEDSLPKIKAQLTKFGKSTQRIINIQK